MKEMFYLFFLFIVIERVVELTIARRNERTLKAMGAKEFGVRHYRWIVIMHILFLLSFASESLAKGADLSPRWPLLFGLFVATQGLRVWTLRSLGRFWNTKILVLPNAKVVAKGPYRWLRHPNYLVVVLEMWLIPLMFQAYGTALVFSVANAVMLAIRIDVEEKALKSLTNYADQFDERPRFLPLRPVK
ncbi:MULTISPECIES: isoprenylcysteine carboxylmethyltransferase family protein [Parageobacillus]|nr:MULTISPECIES: isoprenylcysteine carboxylmethyltransferase family protein [Parageobacillus]